MGLNYTFAGQTGPISLSTLDTALGDASCGSFKNKIIGGDFTVNPWQRGTSFTGPANNAYTSDRWFVNYVTSGVFDVLKTADAPTADQAGVYTQHCLHVDVTTADASIAIGDIVGVQQCVEGLNAASFGFGQSGTRYVTLSFWHKHTKTGTYCVAVRNSAATRSYVAEYTQDVTDTWEKATITIPVDTSGTWLYDTGIGLRLDFTLAGGTTFQTTANTWAAGNFRATSNQVNALDSTSNNFKIALVQLEAGSVATPFESRPVGTELALCQRYYWRLGNASLAYVHTPGVAVSTTQAYQPIKLPGSMRTAPSSIEVTGTASDYQCARFGSATAIASSVVPSFLNSSTDSVTVQLTVASGFTNGAAGLMYFNNSTAYIGFPAEL